MTRLTILRLSTSHTNLIQNRYAKRANFHWNSNSQHLLENHNALPSKENLSWKILFLKHVRLLASCGIYTLNCHSNLNNYTQNIYSKLSDSPTPKSYSRMEISWGQKNIIELNLSWNPKNEKYCTYELPWGWKLTVSPESITPYKYNVGNRKN